MTPESIAGSSDTVEVDVEEVIQTIPSEKQKDIESFLKGTISQLVSYQFNKKYRS